MRGHPERRLIVATLCLVLGSVPVLIAALVTGATSGATPSPQSAVTAAPPAGTSETTPTPSPAATPSPNGSMNVGGPVPASAVQVARSFLAAYLDYDWHQGPPSGQAIRPWSDDRLYWLVVGGQDTSGMPAPWTGIDTTAHETTKATILSLQSQQPDALDAAVQTQVLIQDAFDRGHWSGREAEDLGLRLESGHWLVDQVNLRTSGASS